MKLVKLSLVAAMAAGVFATTASAAPFEEVIKDVDVSGYARLRYTSTHKKEKEDGEDTKKSNKSNWNFKGELNLKSKIDDNFFTVVGIRYFDEDSASHESTAVGIDNGGDDFDIHRAYLGYSVGNTVIQVGRQDVGAFFTDDMYGDGIKILNSDIEGLTLAALWMDSLERDGDILSGLSTGKYLGEDKDEYEEAHGEGSWKEHKMDVPAVKFVTGKEVTDHNLYGVAAIGNYDPVSFQLWYAALEDVTDLFAAELAFNFDVSDDVNIGLRGQYAFSDFDGKFKNAIKNAGVQEVDDSDFYAVEASTNLYGFDLSAGYIDFSTDKGKYSLSSFEDDGAFINAGEELLDYSWYEGENSYWFVTAGYNIPDTGLRLGVDYVDGKTKTKSEAEDVKVDKSEIVARIDYKYNKKLNFKSWYSYVKEKGDGWKDEQSKIRFEAKYSF